MEAKMKRKNKKFLFFISLLAMLFLIQGCAKFYNVTIRSSYKKPDLDRTKIKKAAILLENKLGESDFSAIQDLLSDFASSGMGRSSGQSLRAFEHLFLNSFASTLSKKGFQVMERTLIARVEQEQAMIDKKFSDLSDEEKVRRLGKIMNVDVIFFCTLFEFSSMPWSLHGLNTNAGAAVRGIDVATGEIIWINFTGINYMSTRFTRYDIENDHNYLSMGLLTEKLLEDFLTPTALPEIEYTLR